MVDPLHWAGLVELFNKQWAWGWGERVEVNPCLHIAGRLSRPSPI